jgi:hypothetical protein
MEMTFRELWTAVHGMVLGAMFLLAFTGGFMALWGLRSQWLTADGAKAAGKRLVAWTWFMAVLVWLTVLVGSYVVYPWYRAKPPANAAGAALAHFPKFYLVSSPRTAEWHEFGMEWKEHVAWLAPLLATAVAAVVTCYRKELSSDSTLRWAVLSLYSLAFFTASIAGLLGALIDKVAPTH